MTELFYWSHTLVNIISFEITKNEYTNITEILSMLLDTWCIESDGWCLVLLNNVSWSLSASICDLVYLPYNF